MNSFTQFYYPLPSSTFIKSWIWSIVSKLYHKSKQEIELELGQIRKSQKDPREFAPIYNKYYDEIFVYISRRIDDIDIVADITSKTFTRCLINLHKFKFMGVPFSAWLYKIAINEVRQFYRHRRNMPRTVCISATDFSEIVHETITANKYEMANELVPKLLGTLKEKELQCIELRFFEKKSFKEIGFIMGLTEVNAKIKTYRILKKLKEIALKN